MEIEKFQLFSVFEDEIKIFFVNLDEEIFYKITIQHATSEGLQEIYLSKKNFFELFESAYNFMRDVEYGNIESFYFHYNLVNNDTNITKNLKMIISNNDFNIYKNDQIIINSTIYVLQAMFVLFNKESYLDLKLLG